MTKEELTAVFMRELSIHEDKFKDCIWSWWQNPISKSSLRLTNTGFHVLSIELGLEFYTMRIENSQLGKNLRIYQQLDRYISSPFFIPRRDKIIFFGSKDKIVLELMGGDLDQYLKNFED